MYTNVHCSNINDRTWKQPRYLLRDESKKKSSYILHWNITHPLKKWIWVRCSKMNEARISYTEWRKSEREKQVCYLIWFCIIVVVFCDPLHRYFCGVSCNIYVFIYNSVWVLCIFWLIFLKICKFYLEFFNCTSRLYFIYSGFKLLSFFCYSSAEFIIFLVPWNRLFIWNLYVFFCKHLLLWTFLL